jgi:hypothetical protein
MPPYYLTQTGVPSPCVALRQLAKLSPPLWTAETATFFMKRTEATGRSSAPSDPEKLSGLQCAGHNGHSRYSCGDSSLSTELTPGHTGHSLPSTTMRRRRLCLRSLRSSLRRAGRLRSFHYNGHLLLKNYPEDGEGAAEVQANWVRRRTHGKIHGRTQWLHRCVVDRREWWHDRCGEVYLPSLL